MKDENQPLNGSRKKYSQKQSKVKPIELDYKKLVKEIPSNKRSVTLKKTKNAGIGLFATKDINKGKTIVYYKLKIFKDTSDDKYKSPTDRMYAIAIYTKGDKERFDVIGDITKDSVPPPKNDIPYWGHFANEPSGNNVENAELDLDLKKNYKNKSKLHVSDFVVYRLKSIRDIKAGDEICWCYGQVYGREYEVNCCD